MSIPSAICKDEYKSGIQDEIDSSTSYMYVCSISLVQYENIDK